jgi:hypothetical protein
MSGRCLAFPKLYSVGFVAAILWRKEWIVYVYQPKAKLLGFVTHPERSGESPFFAFLNQM